LNSGEPALETWVIVLEDDSWVKAVEPGISCKYLPGHLPLGLQQADPVHMAIPG